MKCQKILFKTKQVEVAPTERLNIPDAINWVAISKQLPHKNIYVWLCNVDENITGHEYVVEFDLTTQHFQRKWTHWAVAKPPCL